MKIRSYGTEDYNTGKWSGGETTEFAIYPEKANYIDRDFIWRLSSATVDVEESTFTKLPDFDRILMVLEGEAVLAHGNERTVKLTALEQDSFSGDAGTKSFGKIKDYNLIMKKGCSGSLKVYEVQSAAQIVEKTDKGEHTHASYGFYCIEGYVVVSAAGETHMVPAGKQLVLDLDEGESVELSVMGEGKAVVAEVFYTRLAHAAVEIPEEKATFEDFKTAFKLARGNSKWKKAFQKNKGSDVWYDEALQRKISFLDKTYIGIILWAAICIVFVILAARGMSHSIVIAVLIAWTVLYALVISPLIYMIVLPKPIKAHIKKVDSLTEYELELYLKEQGENEMTDKLLKKYKYSRGEGWDVDEESIFSKLKK
ncbi:MAG: HutD family protein [Firmicutes bacterium]|nr:HutD family protein [Bacillota bacterium]